MHLWTNQPAPPEWTTYVLCSHFHKLPGELYAEPYEYVRDMMTCMYMEQKVNKARSPQPHS